LFSIIESVLSGEECLECEVDHTPPAVCIFTFFLSGYTFAQVKLIFGDTSTPDNDKLSVMCRVYNEVRLLEIMLY
jgi:hypothetical protein